MLAFSKKLKELRTAAGMSQEALAEQIGISLKSIQRYEKDQRPDTFSLVKIATFFNVSTDYLLGLKSYQEDIKERKRVLRDEEGYSVLYSHYLKCLNQYEISENAVYYWIEMDENHIGGHTFWKGWADGEMTKEVRSLQEVIPEVAIELCTNTYGKPMILNSMMDAIVFSIYGGQAIVRKDICEKYLPEFKKEQVFTCS